MKVDSQAFERMAKLDLPAEEREWAAEKIDILTEDFSQLSNIDTAGTEPLITVLPLSNILREDISEKKYARETILANAPEQYDGYFQVPKTLE